MKRDIEDKNRGAKNKISVLRQGLRLAQADLAARCGVSRQFLSLVESGRAQPNVQIALRLAEELACSVEDLFGAPNARPAQGLIVQLAQPRLSDGTRIDLASVDGRWVAHASDNADSLGGGFQECDAVLGWIEGRAEAKPHRPIADLEKNIAIAGCDPALALLRGAPGSLRSGSAALPGRCFWVNCGSARALQLLAEGWVHAAGLHSASDHPDENLRQVRRLDPVGNWQVLHFTRWESGWMLRPDVQPRFHGTPDLVANQLRLANREAGAGNRHWLDAELVSRGISPAQVTGYDTELSSHWECARALREGRADVAVGPQAIASAFGLAFVPTGGVSFDLVIPKTHLDHPTLQALLQRVRSTDFRREVETLAGYEAGTAGDRIE